MNKPIIYCDLDGVLVDFERGVIEKMGKHPDELSQGLMWAVLRKRTNFYENLHWTIDGKQLWDQIKEYNPIILTGCPKGGWAEQQKRNWCKRELGEEIQVITCMTKDKPKYSAFNRILIDDRLKISNEWKKAGGIFIHWKSYEESIEIIKENIELNDETGIPRKSFTNIMPIK